MSFKGLWVVFILASIQMCIVQKGPMSPPHRPGSRLGAVGVDGAWVRSCPRGGRTPSPLRALSADWLSRDAANACITACVRIADHRAMKEATTVCRKGAGVSRALVWARSRRKVTASAAANLHGQDNQAASV